MSQSLAARVRHRALRLASILTLCVTMLATVIAASQWPSEAASAPAAGGVYQIAAANSSKCIEIPSGSTANSALLQQWGCTEATWQRFTVVSQGSNFNLVNATSGKCLDVPYSSTTSGQQLWQYTCGTSLNQQWKFVASGSGYQIVSAVNSLCMTVSGASTANGAAVVQEACAAATHKQWLFTQVGGGTGTPTVAADGTGTYRTVQAAVDAVPANNTSRRVITIKAGTYREIVTIPSTKPYITLQGLGATASQTVIVYNNSAYTSGTSGSASMFVNGHDFTATNLTVANDYDENTYETGDQAVALNLNADRALFSNVRLLGDQDTFLVNDATRAYMVNSYVEGTVDFIFGGGTIVINTSTIYQKRDTGGPITAASTAATKTYGYLFYKCNITGRTANTVEFGRPWRPDAQVLYRESTLTNSIKIARPWTDMSTNIWQNARFFEYQNTGAGATTNSNRPQMSDATATNYTPQKYLAGSDGWNPL